MADIVLVNPRFELSYWGLEHALPFFGKKSSQPSGCLPLLAALTPDEHQVTLMDENVEPLDFERLARADIVGLTGMNVQRRRMREILSELKRRGIFTVVGGPWITVHEEYFEDLPDVIFVGEADTTWPQFLDEWRDGKHQPRYEQSERTDLTTLPPPRYDLLKMRHYLFGSVQFSRGCPFECEFCDIIVTFGRRPRLKTSQQIIAELSALRDLGINVGFVVDDNLIGNKKAIKAVLRDVAEWQRDQGYPLRFATEASLDLAEDEELMRLMDAANIQIVFIGIESPNEDSLRETKKYQNVRPGAGILERVYKVQSAGLEVWCGMIVGFDHDGPSVFAAQREFVRHSRIAYAMVGMLSAIPKTPLHERLAAENRLSNEEDEERFGTNVMPAQMSREELREGYVELMLGLYAPKAFFTRCEDLYIHHKLQSGMAEKTYWSRNPWAAAKKHTIDVLVCAAIFWRLMRGVPDPDLRKEYRYRLRRLLRARREPTILLLYLLKCASHYHHYRMAQGMARHEVAIVNTF